MKDSINIRREIRQRFSAMLTKYDFLELVNYTRPFVLGEDSKPFTHKQLSWFYNIQKPGARYHQFSIRKKSGKERQIHAPVNSLKYFQSVLSFILNAVFDPQPNSFGFVPGKSVVDNARRHANSRYVFNVDIKDFFPSIDQARVWKCLQLKPFNLVNSTEQHKLEISDDASISFTKAKELTFEALFESLVITLEYTDYRLIPGSYEVTDLEKNIIAYSIVCNKRNINSGNIIIAREESTSNLVDYGKEINTENIKIIAQLILTQQKEILNTSRSKLANIIAGICCTNLEVDRKENGEFVKKNCNVLPQGAPTSPVITNIICQRLDFLLTGLAKRFNVRYSRYADDITFSSNQNVYQKNGAFFQELNRIIEDQGFMLNPDKTRLQKETHRQEVTGLTVNVEPNVPKRYIKQLRSWLYIWENYGYNKGTALILQNYRSDKGHVKPHIARIENIIRGKLDYLKMVKGPKSDLYFKLNERYEKLTKKVEIEPVFIVEQDSTEEKIAPVRLRSLHKLIKEKKTQNIIDKIFSEGLDEAMKKYKP